MRIFPTPICLGYNYDSTISPVKQADQNPLKAFRRTALEISLWSTATRGFDSHPLRQNETLIRQDEGFVLARISKRFEARGSE